MLLGTLLLAAQHAATFRIAVDAAALLVTAGMKSASVGSHVEVRNRYQGLREGS
jgi:hypothetical protein